MSSLSHSEGLLGRGNFYRDEAGSAVPKKRSTFEDDSLWERTAEAPWKLELLTIFLRNQLRIAPAMPLLTFMLAFTSLMWVPPLSLPCSGWLRRSPAKPHKFISVQISSTRNAPKANSMTGSA
jgi:hypothetical protein